MRCSFCQRQPVSTPATFEGVFFLIRSASPSHFRRAMECATCRRRGVFRKFTLAVTFPTPSFYSPSAHRRDAFVVGLFAPQEACRAVRGEHSASSPFNKSCVSASPPFLIYHFLSPFPSYQRGTCFGDFAVVDCEPRGDQRSFFYFYPHDAPHYCILLGRGASADSTG